MATPVFPPKLPLISTISLSVDSQLKETETESGSKQYSRFTRVPSAKSNITWRFLEDDYQIFKNFWKVDLIRGHRWFTLVLPCAGGFAPHVVRFVRHYTATRDGYDYRTVTADIEIRERILRIVNTTTIVTSTLYPLYVIESLDPSLNAFGGSLKTLSGFADDSIDASLSIFSGELREILKQGYSDESINANLIFVSGELRDILKQGTSDDFMDVSLSFQSGSLLIKLISTENNENIDVGLSFISGSLV